MVHKVVNFSKKRQHQLLAWDDGVLGGDFVPEVGIIVGVAVGEVLVVDKGDEVEFGDHTTQRCTEGERQQVAVETPVEALSLLLADILTRVPMQSAHG